jgi:flagellar assembly factor FliW
MPLGLLGFESIKQYVMLTNPDEYPFLWLQVLEDPNLAFLVISPFTVVPDYQPDIPNEDVEFLGLKEASDALIYNIVTLKGPGLATVNLKGPVVLNRNTLIGKQVVIANAADYALQHSLPLCE